MFPSINHRHRAVAPAIATFMTIVAVISAPGVFA